MDTGNMQRNRSTSAVFSEQNEPKTVRSPGLILAMLCIAQLLLIIDVVIVNVALPTIRESLGINPSQVQLTSITYTLIFGSLLIVAGRLGDLFGRRKLVLIGVLIFTAASLASGLAQSGWQLFAARALQGLGAALISPNALALLTSLFPEGTERNQAFGIWAAVGSGGAILGQVLGGVLTELAGWRWIFLINVPIGLVLIIVATRLLPESRSPQAQRVDLLGAFTLAGSLGSLTFALTRVAEQLYDLVFGVSVVLALVFAVLFVLIERRHSEPLVRFGMLQNSKVRIGNLSLALNSGALTATLFFTTLYLQSTLAYSPLVVGFGFAPVTLVVLAVSPFAGRAVSRVGARRMLVLGGLSATAGMLYLSRVPVNGSYVGDVLPGLLLVALGSGLSYAPTFTLGTSGITEADQGLASGLLNTAQEIGAALGLALLVALALGLVGGTAETELTTVQGYRIGYLSAAAFQFLAVLVVFAIRSHAKRD